MSVALVSHPACDLHVAGPGHPERPARLVSIRRALRAAGLDRRLDAHEAPRATREQLLRVHDAAYLDRLAAAAPSSGRVELDPDTAIGPHSLEAAHRAAGAVVRAVDLVLEGAATAAFCPVRPPGHHARRDRAMGFCLFNNVGVGAAHALAAHGLTRVAIADFDVHRGNGTEETFAGDARVLVLSSFQHPFYPGGDAPDADNVVAVRFARGADSAEFRAALGERWFPALRAFAPELVLVSAGFDGHVEESLAETRWVEDDYRWVTDELCAAARESCAGRVVSTLEGGYALPALGRCVVAHVEALLAAPRGA